MSVNLLELLGTSYENLMDAKVDKSPSEVVVTNDGAETFYIVERDVFDKELHSIGFRIVVSDGE